MVPIPTPAPNPALLPAVVAARAAAFQKRYPKLDPGADSMRGLIETFRRTGSGGRPYQARPGQYLPVHTRAAAPELRTIIAFAGRPDVTRIRVVPSQPGQRTPDLVVDRRNGDGVVRPTRVEVTTITGGRRGYRPTGEHAGPTEVGEIVEAVRRKVRPARGQSQLAVPLAGVPAGGILVVHILKGGPGAITDRDVVAAMTRLEPELQPAHHLEELQFVLPDKWTVRYFRTPAGTYARVS